MSMAFSMLARLCTCCGADCDCGCASLCIVHRPLDSVPQDVWEGDTPATKENWND